MSSDLPDLEEQAVDAAKRAFRACDYELHVKLVKAALSFSLPTKTRFWLRVTMAAALQLSKSATSSDLREAVEITNGLLSEVTPASSEWTMLHRRLGHLWLQLADDDAPSKSRFHFDEALRSPSLEPELRATTLVQSAYAVVRERGHDYVEDARSRLNEAARVFTATEYPEEFEEITFAQASLVEGHILPADEGLVNAVTNGRIVRVTELLASGSDVDTRDDEGSTVLQIALADGRTKVARVLRDAGADRLARDRDGFTALHWAVFGELEDLLEIAFHADLGVEPQDKWGRTPLSWAAAHNWIGGARWLLDHGADPNLGDTDGWTPLHYAAADNRREVADVLLKAGARRSLTSKGDERACDVAARLGYAELASRLSMLD